MARGIAVTFPGARDWGVGAKRHVTQHDSITEWVHPAFRTCPRTDRVRFTPSWCPPRAYVCVVSMRTVMRCTSHQGSETLGPVSEGGWSLFVCVVALGGGGRCETRAKGKAGARRRRA